jgi:hypothetical protein
LAPHADIFGCTRALRYKSDSCFASANWKMSELRNRVSCYPRITPLLEVVANQLRSVNSCYPKISIAKVPNQVSVAKHHKPTRDPLTIHLISPIKKASLRALYRPSRNGKFAQQRSPCGLRQTMRWWLSWCVVVLLWTKKPSIARPHLNYLHERADERHHIISLCESW